MLTFAFVVVMMGANEDGSNQDYIMDYGMTYEDCVERVESYLPTAEAMGYIMSCAPETETFKAYFN